ELRFQQIYVGEPSVEDTIAILRGLKERYEVHHGVRIKDSAIVAAATLSSRYITDRFLPDKAIDLIDEAASRLRIEIDSLPQELETLERRAVQIQIEQKALEKETDSASRTRRDAIARELGELREEVDEEEVAAIVSRWTGIPVSRMLEGEVQKLLKMEDRLRERVVGQDEAVAAVSQAVRRARAGLADPHRPLGSFLFMGPTGVGK